MPAPAVNLRDLEAQAYRTLPPAHWAYLHGCAADGDTASSNQQDWQDLRLWPRVLHDLRPSGQAAATATRLAGQPLAHPILLAPVAYQQLAHPDGERATALAAAAQGAGMVLSSQSSTPMEAVAEIFAQEPAAGPLWFQLYWQGDLDRSLALVRRAHACGYQAIVLTVDAPVQGVRDAERRAGFTLPAGVRAVNLPPASNQGLAELLAQAPRWAEVGALQAACAALGLGLWLKGVLHPHDAAQAVAMGVAGLIVSNHGGRTLDTTVSTAWALPQVRAAVPPDFPLLVDGGIRRGTDVFKALALGANAVLVGRPQVHALACEGALGVARMIRLLRDEFAAALALCACATVSDIHPAHLALNTRHNQRP